MSDDITTVLPAAGDAQGRRARREPAPSTAQTTPVFPPPTEGDLGPSALPPDPFPQLPSDLATLDAAGSRHGSATTRCSTAYR